MSATPFNSRPSRVASTDALDADATATRSGKRLLVVVFGLVVAWSAALFLMDVHTANPQIVSRDQILAADVVVIARRIRPEDGHLKISRVFLGDAKEGDELRVRNLEKTVPLMADRDYVIPLSRIRNEYRVTTLPGQQEAAIAYSATPATIDTVKSILRNDH